MVKKDMHILFLSPHFDDVALSCGGFVWEKSRIGETVSIWTICAGDVPPGPLSAFAEKLHTRWQTGREAVTQRRLEDAASCQILGASFRHLAVPDCIYRTYDHSHLYSEETFMGPIHPAENALVDALAQQLQQELLRQDLPGQDLPGHALVISPLALGGHVDHRLTRAVAEKLDRELLYYADYPYCLNTEKELEQMRDSGWQPQLYPVSPEGLQAWQQGVAAYASQISTFWSDLSAMQQAIKNYRDHYQGSLLWQAPGRSQANLRVD